MFPKQKREKSFVWQKILSFSSLSRSLSLSFSTNIKNIMWFLCVYDTYKYNFFYYYSVVFFHGIFLCWAKSCWYKICCFFGYMGMRLIYIYWARALFQCVYYGYVHIHILTSRKLHLNRRREWENWFCGTVRVDNFWRHATCDSSPIQYECDAWMGANGVRKWDGNVHRNCPHYFA